jgi:hypothetical protein
MTSSRWILPRRRNISDKCIQRKSKHILYSLRPFPPSPPKIVPFMTYWWQIWQFRSSHRWQYGAFALHAGYVRLHKLLKCNNYCFFMATMIVRMRIHVALYAHRMSCSSANRRPICQVTPSATLLIQNIAPPFRTPLHNPFIDELIQFLISIFYARRHVSHFYAKCVGNGFWIWERR